MSFSLNKVIFAGTLADKPSARHIDAGKKIVGLSVVTTRRWLDAKNVDQRSDEWHRTVVLNAPLVAYAERKLSKGDEVYIEAELHTELWRDETYKWRTLTKIVLWQESHQLRRLADCERQPSLDCQPRHLLYAVREDHLLETAVDNPRNGHAARCRHRFSGI